MMQSKADNFTISDNDGQRSYGHLLHADLMSRPSDTCTVVVPAGKVAKISFSKDSFRSYHAETRELTIYEGATLIGSITSKGADVPCIKRTGNTTLTIQSRLTASKEPQFYWDYRYGCQNFYMQLSTDSYLDCAYTVSVTYVGVHETVTLDRNGGSGGSATVSVTFGAAMPQITTPSRGSGYSFDGYWFGNTQYYSLTGRSLRNWDSPGAKLTARWQAWTRTLTFDRRGGTGGPDDMAVTYGDVLPRITPPTKTGYSFQGYNTRADGGGTYYYSSDGTSKTTWNETNNRTLYAIWSAKTYTVSFSANGASNEMKPVLFTHGVAKELPRNTFTSSHSTFLGWAKSENGDVVYSDGQKITVTENILLYAKWKTLPLYKVTFKANGGEGEMQDMLLYEGKSKNLVMNEFSRTGYRFAGWTVSPSGDVRYADGGEISIRNNLTLYAKWTADTSIWNISGGVLYKAIVNDGQEKLDIPEGIVKIGSSAFAGCTLLQSVKIPDSVTSIEEGAFAGCIGLKSLAIPNGVTSIGRGAFRRCTSLVEVTLSTSLTSISDDLFHDCHSLSSITIPASVTSIGSNAFYDCRALGEVSIPSSVASIGYSAFEKCTSLTRLSIGNPHVSIGHCAFSGCRGLADADGFVIVKGVLYNYVGNALIVTIPAGVVCVGDGAFAGNKTMQRLNINTRLESIGANAFDCCTGLNTIRGVDGYGATGAVFVDTTAFRGCTGLRDVNGFVIVDGILSDYSGTSSVVNIPTGVKTIGQSAFEGNGKIVYVSFPDSLQSIDARAFMDCISLSSLELPDGVREIGSFAFGGCQSLSEVTMGSGLETVASFAFAFCPRLKNVEVKSGREFWWGVFEGGNMIEMFDIPSTAVEIGSFMFKDCNFLRTVRMHEGLLEIGSEAFSLTGVQCIVVPQSVSRIATNAFASAGLGKIYLPEKFRGSAFASNVEGVAEVLYFNGVTGEVRFDPNGGYGRMISSPLVPGHSVPLFKNSFQHSSLSFAGWSRTPDGDIVYADGAPVTFSENGVTLYAQWRKAYRATFDGNGGTLWSSDQEQVFLEGIPKAVSAYIPIGKYGHELTYWEEIETGNLYTNGQVIVAEDNMKFRAMWSPKWFRLTFDSSYRTDYDMGGERTVEMCAYGSKIVQPATPEREGFTFLGWSSKVAETMPAGDLYYAAVWQMNDYTVEFDSLGGDAVPSVTKKFRDSIYVPSTKRSGYVFKGWSDEEGGEAKYLIGDFIPVLRDEKLYAVWRKVDCVEFIQDYAEFGEGETVSIGVIGRGSSRITSVKVYISYQSATAADIKYGDYDSNILVCEYPGGGRWNKINHYHFEKFPIEVRWAPGTTKEMTIEFDIRKDSLVEGGEFFTLQLAGASGVELGERRTCTVRIKDAQWPDGMTPEAAAARGQAALPAGATAVKDAVGVMTGYFTKKDKKGNVTAKAMPGYIFTGWYDAKGKLVNSKAALADNARKSKKATPKFAVAHYLRGLADPANGGKVTGSGLYAEKKSVTLKATPKKNWTFEGWRLASDELRVTSDELVSKSKSLTVSVTNELTYLAMFKPYPKVTVAVDNKSGGTVKGAGSYLAGKTATLTATPKKGYAFCGWFDADGNLVSLSASYKYKMAADGAALSASFKKESALAKPVLTWGDYVSDGGGAVATSTSLTVGVAYSAKLSVVGESAVSITKVTGLPKGLTFKSGKVSGVPTVAKAVTAKVTVALKSNAKKTWTYSVKLNVAALPTWAVGTFKGTLYDGSDESVASPKGIVTLTVGKTGKVSGKFVDTKKKSYAFTVASFKTYGEDGVLRTKATMKYGKKSVTVEIAVGQDGETSVGFAEVGSTAAPFSGQTAVLVK